MSLNLFSVATLLFLGLALGSFGSVIVARVPQGRGIGGRSVSPCCKKKIAARDLIPLASYALLRGRCRVCHRRIALRYPLLEAFSAVLIALPSLHEGYIDSYTFATGVALWLFLLLAAMDAESQHIPDAVTLPFLGFALFAAYLRGYVHWLGPLLGGGFFSLQWVLSRGRVLGSGDIFMGIAMGLLLDSWQETLLGIALSYSIGAAIVSVLLVTGRAKRTDRIAFIPYVFAGTLVAYLGGAPLLSVLAPWAY